MPGMDEDGAAALKAKKANAEAEKVKALGDELKLHEVFVKYSYASHPPRPRSSSRISTIPPRLYIIVPDIIHLASHLGHSTSHTYHRTTVVAYLSRPTHADALLPPPNTLAVYTARAPEHHPRRDAGPNLFLSSSLPCHIRACGVLTPSHLDHAHVLVLDSVLSLNSALALAFVFVSLVFASTHVRNLVSPAGRVYHPLRAPRVPSIRLSSRSLSPWRIGSPFHLSLFYFPSFTLT
ncbi:uncharacterized protein BXZ73DRAFT_106862 [Epithele typhae]|uniref:uncharacterized protein n=1 Tax=Epithele typhae TaxID=378194 RepID=UPI0020089B7B|nr:uncharacterized protein BXZ73DRAFT_106862 [Epithele typhae]KAH9913683.1 hypothetical protein BXZ73DRAFT_106862 [Epithele typhae]